MPNNFEGPFDRAEFAGATVYSFTASNGWKEQSSFINLYIVEDPSNNDSFELTDDNPQMLAGQLIGTPFQFTYGNFTFGGLLKSVDQVDDFSTHPSYHVVLSTPIEVLDSCQVILSNFVGPVSDIVFNSDIQSEATFQVSNLLNVYGWAENGGQNFGRSESTDIGMPWNGTYGIYNGLIALSNTPPDKANSDPTTNFGSYINYRNNYYKLDLSALPTPPNFYYLGGVTNMSLMELISKFFEDAGCDYIVKLTVNPDNNAGPHTISFIVVPRFIQQQLGKIYPYILSQPDMGHYSHGQELRSDITQAFLIGGSVNLLQPLYNNNVDNLTILPFWGFDLSGNPIMGSKPDGTQFADDDYEMSLNGSAIADLLGELGIFPPMYATNIFELRCALGNYDTWAAFIKLYKPDLAKQLQIYSMYDTGIAPLSQLIFDLINDDPKLVTQNSEMFQNAHWPAVSQRLYEWIRQQAETYYGKKFIVKLPFDVQVKIDPTTSITSFNYEIADAGYYPEGIKVLDLNYINENFFLDQTGRFYPIIRFNYVNAFTSIAGSKLVAPNVSYLNSTACVIQYNDNPENSYVFCRCEQGESAPVYQNGFIGGSPIFFIQTSVGTVVPAIVMEISDPVVAQADDITGSLTDIATMLNIPLVTLQQQLQVRATSFSMVIHPPMFYPNAIAVAMKSNQFTYGPWGKFSANGKIEVEQDDGLTPWNYGGYDIMNIAAEAKIATIAMGNQVLERGNLYQAGIPQASIGDQLIQDGPILTGIECSISTSEVTTTYNMETFVNRTGAFITENAERLKRIGKIYQQMRRTIREQIIQQIKQSLLFQQCYKGFMFGTSYSIQQGTPHGCLGASLYKTPQGNYRPFSWTQTFQESISNVGANNSGIFNSSACVSLDAILRPYTTNIKSKYLPVFTEPDPGFDLASYKNDFKMQTITSTGTLNPIVSGCDIQWLLSSSSYDRGMKQFSNTANFNDVRSLALRGPLVICGWGYDFVGNPFPNSGAFQFGTVDAYPPLSDMTNQFLPNYLQQSISWPCGPLDVSWDKYRGVWASRGMILCGVASGDILPASTGYMNIYVAGKPSNEVLPVKNFLQSQAAKITDKTLMMCGYDPFNGYWRPIQTDCVTS